MKKGATRPGASCTLFHKLAIRALLTLASIAAPFRSTPGAAPTADDWKEAGQNIVRLPPRAFAGLPGSIVAWLDERGYRIPQSFCEAKPHNVFRAEVMKPGRKDWVVLGSVRDTSEILVFPGGSTAGIIRLERRDDQAFLQGVDQDSIGYSRLITAAGPATVIGYHQAYEMQLPFPIRHSGIEDYFCEKGSTILYFHENRWHELPGSD